MSRVAVAGRCLKSFTMVVGTRGSLAMVPRGTVLSRTALHSLTAPWPSATCLRASRQALSPRKSTIRRPLWRPVRCRSSGSAAFALRLERRALSGVLWRLFCAESTPRGSGVTWVSPDITFSARNVGHDDSGSQPTSTCDDYEQVTPLGRKHKG